MRIQIKYIKTLSIINKIYEGLHCIIDRKRLTDCQILTDPWMRVTLCLYTGRDSYESGMGQVKGILVQPISFLLNVKKILIAL